MIRASAEFLTPSDSVSEILPGDWNLQEWKMTDEVAGVEIAGLENDGVD